MGIWDTITGSNAAATSNAAAADTYGKIAAASKGLKKAGQRYEDRFTGLAEGFQPWQDAGTDALAMQRAGLGLDGGAGSERFTSSYRATPGYAAGRASSLEAAEAALNAGNRFNSGATLKALGRTASNYEDSRVNDFLTRLAQMSGTGLDATSRAVTTEGTGLTGNLNAQTNAGQMMATGAPIIGQGMVAGANAEASGIQNLLSLGTSLAGGLLGGGGGMSGVGSGIANLFRGSAAPAAPVVNPWAGGSGYAWQNGVRAIG